MPRVEKCPYCESILNSEGECPNECTEDPNYGVIEGVNQTEESLRSQSTKLGVCQKCFGKMIGDFCPNGCFGMD